ncbi:DUF1214 domain-containing protein [Mangrovicella endophytica]|uniref:DUF1214 domain-containing protein n=1 Tax=Mangrovicella endophytica TaxID=2066697 RepID=UPI000C9E8953|nr:DUF1214 domain-containing protein [Mangrovicella endophytica]
MRSLILLFLALALALGLGGWSAQWALDKTSELGTEAVGPWLADPQAGSPDADPYTRAQLAHLGNLTLGSGEGIVFRAVTDQAGAPLRRECSYAVAGQTPPARVWTLAAFTLDGRLIQPGEGRPGWAVSGDLLRHDDNSFNVVTGPLAAAGNWLATTGSGPFVLALTLYDTPASSSSGVADLTMPTIVRNGCANG